MQKKKIVNSLIFLSLFASLVSCNGDNQNSSSEEKEYIAKSLGEAIENTKSNYQLDVNTDMGFTYPFQIISNEIYYYAPGDQNYILLKEDPNYYHSFLRTYLDVPETYRFGMDVCGRAGFLSDKENLFSNDFLNILETYKDDFSKKDARTYCCSVKDLAYDLTNYFQNKAFTYTNYFEVTLGSNGKLDTFSIFEKSLDEAYLSSSVSFKSFDISNFEPYTLWNEAGRKINPRIMDLKGGSLEGITNHLFYENEEVSFEGIVSSITFDNHLIVATKDDISGFMGVEVILKEGTSLPSLKDKIKVSGKVVAENSLAKIENATFNKIGVEEYFPVFDEETLQGSEGGGYYAAYIFQNAPIFSDSVYSTYAYLDDKTITVSENGDTHISIIFPKQHIEKDTYRSEIVLPKTLTQKQKEDILSKINGFGIYGSSSSPKEMCLKNFILRFDANYKYKIRLEYASNSEISNSLTPSEKVKKLFGLENFPMPEADSYRSFTFGGHTDMNLEDTYGKEGNTVGIFYNSDGLLNSKLEEFTSSLITYGFSFYDEIVDASRSLHKIYKMNDMYVDMLINEAMFSDDSKSIYMWVYKGDLIRCASIEEILAEKVPYFDSSDFVRAANTTSSKYSYYALPSLGGNIFTEGNYLPTITIDTVEDCFSSLRQSYIKDKGYKTYRNADNSIYTYKTRNSNHYVLYKEIPNSEEKLFLDMASYPTSDYTFYGHSSFNTRIEISIYKGLAPLSTKLENNLDGFVSHITKNNKDATFSVAFENGETVENYPSLDGGSAYEYIYYGYNYDYNSFIYTSNITKTNETIVSSLLEAGYVLSSTTQKGNETYVKQKDINDFNATYVFILKNTEGNYIRLINGLGGVDF